MQANQETFKFMFIKKYRSKEIIPEFVKINGSAIKLEKEVKLLGITIDEKLRFDRIIIEEKLRWAY